MNTKQRTIVIGLVAVSLLTSGCGPGQLFAPALTPTATPTPMSPPASSTSPSTSVPPYTPEPTSTPLLAPTPIPTLTSQDAQPPVGVRPQLQEYYAKLLHLDNQPYPRMDGSTSTEPLQVEIVCSLYALYCPRLLTDPRQNDPAELIYIQTNSTPMEEGQWRIIDRAALPITTHTGTHAAYLNLINGEADLILEARLPSSDELKAAQEKKVELETTAIALDAFVMLAHADNPINSLSLQQIRDIYSGQITNWSQVGGRDMPITPYQREDNSGSQELMKSLVMQDIPLMKAEDLIVYTMLGPFNALNGNLLEMATGEDRKTWPQGDVSGIGYTVYYYERHIAPRYENIKVLAIDGIRPTRATISDHTYPLASEVYVVVRAGLPADSSTRRLRDWLTPSDTTQTLPW